MRYYEALFIIHPNYEQDRLKAIVNSVANEITKHNGVMINKIDWGKRRLGYAIEKQKYGNYVLFHFEADPSIITKIYAWMEIQANILSQIIVKLEEKPEIIVKDSFDAVNENTQTELSKTEKTTPKVETETKPTEEKVNTES